MDLYYCIAAYNEEKNISFCLRSLAKQNFRGLVETIICLNGCNDNTEKKVLNAKIKYPNLNIKIIHSNKGLSFAQNAIVKSITNTKIPLVFIDADVKLHPDSIQKLYDEMQRNKQLIIVGAWPVPEKIQHLSFWKYFLFKTLHVRALYPESEISCYDVQKFKSYVDDYPQSGVSVQFEKKSKIYFHGRTFMVKNSTYYDIPNEKNICDDTYMPNHIHTIYGPGTIRTRYDATVFYKPYLSLREHFKIYRRIFFDLRHLDDTQEKFKATRHLEKTKLDWQYIIKQDLYAIFYFICYFAIIKIEKMLYILLPKRKLDDAWVYATK